ncbi:MAG: PEP-CTERM sorting domain-containing protein [Desulfobacterales bacterium]|nr:PEP-CTERM sorting domain-containing protein [Desulfobacterales bacterium]
MKKFLSLLIGILLVFMIAGGVNATLLTSFSDYSGPGLDLSAYQTGSYNFTFGPESIPGGITFTAAPGGGGNSGQGSVLGQGSYGLASNGSFGGDAVYAGVDSRTGYADFTFDSELSSFGAFFNYAPQYGDAPTISVLDSLGVTLESWDLSVYAPISTPGGFNEFEFRGIDLGNDVFKTFRFGGSYILAAASPSGDPTNPLPAVPEPTTILLFGIGLLGFAGVARRKKQ